MAESPRTPKGDKRTTPRSAGSSRVASLLSGVANREKPNDVFITPRELALTCINRVRASSNGKKNIFFEPFRNSAEGPYYSQFPASDRPHLWTEILEGKDFFKFELLSTPIYLIFSAIAAKHLSPQPA